MADRRIAQQRGRHRLRLRRRVQQAGGGGTGRQAMSGSGGIVGRRRIDPAVHAEPPRCPRVLQLAQARTGKAHDPRIDAVAGRVQRGQHAAEDAVWVIGIGLHQRHQRLDAAQATLGDALRAGVRRGEQIVQLRLRRRARITAPHQPDQRIGTRLHRQGGVRVDGLASFDRLTRLADARAQQAQRFEDQMSQQAQLVVPALREDLAVVLQQQAQRFRVVAVGFGRAGGHRGLLREGAQRR